MEAAIAGLIGAAIGAVASFGGLWLQQRQQGRHERLKMAVDLAIHDQTRDLEIAKAKQGKSMLSPTSSYVIYHLHLLEALNKGDINAAMIKELSKSHSEIAQAFPGAPEGVSEKYRSN